MPPILTLRDRRCLALAFAFSRGANVRFSNRAVGSSSDCTSVPGCRSRGSRFSSQSGGFCRAKPLHACIGLGLESLACGRALKRSRHLRLHPFLRPRGTIPARIAESCGQVMPQPPIPGGSRYHRPTCGGARRRSCAPPRRWRAGDPWSSSAARPRP